jgi:hypothetical protein
MLSVSCRDVKGDCDFRGTGVTEGFFMLFKIFSRSQSYFESILFV